MSRDKNVLFAERTKNNMYQVWYETECSAKDKTGYGPYKEFRLIENPERNTIDRVEVEFRVKRVHVTSFYELWQCKKLARESNCELQVVEGRY